MYNMRAHEGLRLLYAEMYERFEDEAKATNSITGSSRSSSPGQVPCGCVVYAIKHSCGHTYCRAEDCSLRSNSFRHCADAVHYYNDRLCAFCVPIMPVSPPYNVQQSADASSTHSTFAYQQEGTIDIEEMANADHVFEYTGPADNSQSDSAPSTKHFSQIRQYMVSGSTKQSVEVGNVPQYSNWNETTIYNSVASFPTPSTIARRSCDSPSYILPATVYSPPPPRYNGDDYPCPVHGNTSKYACKADDYRLPPLTYDPSKPGQASSPLESADSYCSCLPSQPLDDARSSVLPITISADISANELHEAVQIFRQSEEDLLRRSQADLQSPISSLITEARFTIEYVRRLSSNSIFIVEHFGVDWHGDLTSSPNYEFPPGMWFDFDGPEPEDYQDDASTDAIEDEYPPDFWTVPDDPQSDSDNESWITITSEDSEDSIISHRDSINIIRQQYANTRQASSEDEASPNLPSARPSTPALWSTSEWSVFFRNGSSQGSQGSTTLVQASTPVAPKAQYPVHKTRTLLDRVKNVARSIKNKVTGRKTGIDGRKLPSKADKVADRINGFVQQYADAKSHTTAGSPKANSHEEPAQFTVVGG